ncbi:hypothetical protein B9479_004801 [Cryptococcus floricola]|uniref:Senescence domain-containing protein n=1 Tax=Cryptococcus floricola TaxID=2591691 RepID=A0A5D3AUQ6_9TREE|nr:hypothetical protein B9479_004801 [Cryptococcus floricola]
MATPKNTQPENVEAYDLLSIDHAVCFDNEEGTLAKGQFRLQCVSLPIPKEIGRQTANPFAPSPSDPPIPTHDYWLIIHVGASFELLATPGQLFTPQVTKDSITYTITSRDIPGASIAFILPYPQTNAQLEDLESLELLLHHYKSMGAEATALAGIEPQNLTGSALAPEELRGKLVLVNNDNGEVLGEMDENLDIEVDKRIAKENENLPVVLDFEQVMEGHQALRVKVKTVPEGDMDDWLLRGANSISRGLLTFGAWSSRQMLSGADQFVKGSTPREKPVVFSPQTKEGFMKVHKASVTTATVTKSTLNKIHGAIQTVAGKTYTHGVQPVMSTYQENYRELAGPPLPPRKQPQQVAASSASQKGAPFIPDKPLKLGGAQVPYAARRSPSPTKGNQLAYPASTQAATGQLEKPPNYSVDPSASRLPSDVVSNQPKKKRGLLSRVVLAGEVVFTSLEATAHDIINNGTIAASTAAGHKYGRDAGEATALVGGSIKNVAVVYVDIAGVGRRALLKSTAKGVIKTRTNDGEIVELRAEGNGNQIRAGEAERVDEGEIVVGMTEVKGDSSNRTSPLKR